MIARSSKLPVIFLITWDYFSSVKCQKKKKKIKSFFGPNNSSEPEEIQF